jgi:hypothetical protein
MKDHFSSDWQKPCSDCQKTLDDLKRQLHEEKIKYWGSMALVGLGFVMPLLLRSC